jgi:uncharacterized protein YjbI with pentapeptide repeats
MKNIHTYEEHIDEAMRPNLVMKGNDPIYYPPKDYLTYTNGDQFRGNGGRSYDKSDFYKVTKYYMDFSMADFDGVDMSRSMFKSCKFNGADMTGCAAEGTRFVNCSFVGATGTENLSNATFDDCSF